MANRAPIYVKIEEYDDLLNTFTVIKKNLKDSKEILGKIAELKAQEDAELEEWYSELSAIDTKMKFIDEHFFDIKNNEE